MKRLMVAAALVAAVMQPAWAAGAKSRGAKANCYSPAAIEAEQAIRFMTDVMVVSSACQDTIYAEFRLRNREPILAYQKALITHFHGTKNFDAWNTTLANQASQKHAGLPTAQICEKDAEMMKTAKTLDPQSFRKYAAAQAQAAGAQYAKCSK
jgi:hypothetical protein